MQTTITLPLLPWPALCTQIVNQLEDAQFAQAGIWQLAHVRIDLPLAVATALAQAPRTEPAVLRQWLARHRLPYAFAAFHRADVGLQLQFVRFQEKTVF